MDNQAFDKTNPSQAPPGWSPPHPHALGSTSGYQPPPGPAPGYYYPNQQPGNYYPPTPMAPGQPQQQVVVVGANPAPAMIITHVGPHVSFTGAIVLSCFVFWCCGWLFGLIAFILAMVGQSSAASGDTNGAMQMRNASYGVSIAGVVIGIIIIAVIAGVLGSAASTVNTVTRTRTCYAYSGYYTYSYTCYN